MNARLTAPVLALLVATAGCGSSNSQPAAATKASFTKQANAICRRAAAQAPAFPGAKDKHGGLRTTAAQVVPYLQKLSAIDRQSLEQLTALDVPAGTEQSVSRLVSAQTARVASLDAALDAAKKGDGAGFTAAFQRDQKQDGPRYARAAHALGLKACGG
jgi:hypothetical protein